MIYSALRPLIFKLDPEQAHELTMKVLSLAGHLPIQHLKPGLWKPRKVMGLEFDNPIGVAAGLDKEGVAVDGLGAMGFGHVEVGTVTPRAQIGNPKPRLFRLPEHQAIINRMGFNNHGVDQLLENLASSRYSGVTGINIGKNFDTPISKAVEDYLICFDKVASRADYVTVNISSPNTQNLRDLQHGDALRDLLSQLKDAQLAKAEYCPIAVKLAPDLSEAELQQIVEIILQCELDGVIATNTTLSRNQVEQHQYGAEKGGLSGLPLKEVAAARLDSIVKQVNGRIAVIAAGGVMEPEDVMQRLDAGADLVQIYTGLIYQGPGFPRKIFSHTH
ncbi:quinone-dependent dihydroorotate dehydrogenase [Pelagibaculum spongiae]|uniref:Dihydroorotate dehydrogenase (quinone) n=1 Tax=Pelagibaculum spongiae TaxID=2080658 RepID=A0A2V1GWL2_9GAMM|nr:quinone-dependent dihydroorotate dehydrogenase [Pelagibaculum spongiae]PVZ71571.1 quinone-dependent dihydroorotate dehydrogenase [Pelagibaculum spongiae]